MGTNSKGESGLFPSNYVELVEDEEEEAPAPPPAPRPEPAAPPTAPRPAAAPAAPSGPTATAIYDYEAAEDNELSFDEGATITGLVSTPLSSKPHNDPFFLTNNCTGIPRRRLVVRPFPREIRPLPSKLCTTGRVNNFMCGGGGRFAGRADALILNHDIKAVAKVKAPYSGMKHLRCADGGGSGW
jgi:hypothetical protein